MPGPVNILIVDDGELEDVRSLLGELGAPFEHRRPKELGVERPEVSQLLVCSAQAGSALRVSRAPGRSCTWIAVADGSATKSSLLLLRRAGFHYLVRRPIHPAALRLLFRAALFSGSEQRQKPRRIAGVPITYRSGAQRRTATLLDLSPGGCRLLAAEELPIGAEIALQFPAELTGEALDLSAVVVRRDAGGSVGLRLARLDRAARERLAHAWRALEQGPLPLPDDAGRKGAVDLRTSPRGIFDSPVVVAARGEKRMLLGRDLSAGGIRIQPDPFLALDDRVRLAIDTSGGSFSAEATVVRDDGADGLALRFDRVQGPGRDGLRAVVALLPSVESLRRPPLHRLRELGAGVLGKLLRRP